MPHSCCRALFVVLAAGIGTAAPLSAGELSMSSGSPPLSDACRAWREHIGELLDQHRVAREIDEKTLFDFVRQFMAARDACSIGSFEVGLRMYGDIRLGRVHRIDLK
jgi:hypothetical protein